MEKSIVDSFEEERNQTNVTATEKEIKSRKLAPNEIKATTPDGDTVIIVYHLT